MNRAMDFMRAGIDWAAQLGLEILETFGWLFWPLILGLLVYDICAFVVLF